MNEAEVWQSDHAWQKQEMDAEITKRKIRKLSFTHNGKLLLVEVGRPNPHNGFPVRSIYQDSKPSCYLICGRTVTIAPADSLVEEA